MKKKLLALGAGILILFILLIVFRVFVFTSLAKFLIVEDDFDKLSYGFVLSGGALDRGNKAGLLYKEKKIDYFICTGANQPSDLKALGLDTLESDLTKLQMIQQGVPDSLISLLQVGTSTREESEAILQYCLDRQLTEIAVISSKFHTRRVFQVFNGKFKKAGIQVFIQGADSSSYKEMEWWKSEYGLIALNNEYLKQVYYLFTPNN